jgi:hypothetical protein
VTTKIAVKRLPVNTSPIRQFLSCHCFHTSVCFFYRRLRRFRRWSG